MDNLKLNLAQIILALRKFKFVRIKSRAFFQEIKSKKRKYIDKKQKPSSSVGPLEQFQPNLVKGIQILERKDQSIHKKGDNVIILSFYQLYIII